MGTDVITGERRGNVEVLHWDDGKVNMVTFDAANAIIEAVNRAEADEDVGALVIAGRPGKFCAGFDLATVTGEDLDAARELVALGGRLVHTMYGSGVPIVAACTGHALAMGAMVLCGADYRVGADIEAKIGMTEVAIGMALPQWAITILEERLSRRHLQLSAATANVYTPSEAVDAGYLDAVVAEGAVIERAVAVAAGMAEQLNVKAYAVTVRRLRRQMLDQLEADITEYCRTGKL